MNWYLECRSGFNAHDSTVAAECKVERHVGVADLALDPIEVDCEPIRLFPTGVEQARQMETCRASHCGQFGVDDAIDHDDAGTVKGRDQVAEVGDTRRQRDGRPE